MYVQVNKRSIHVNEQTKYLELKNYIKQQIIMGKIKPGERIPSENKLCNDFSISRHTVRKAISLLVSEGYLYTEQGLGTYVKDRSIKRTESRNIGVLTTYISDYIFPRVIQGIDTVLSHRGYSIMLKNTDNNVAKEAKYIEEVLSKDLEGLIIEPTKSALYSDNSAYYEALDIHRIPYIFIHGCYQHIKDRSYVILDDIHGMYLAVNHLIKLGHKYIAGIFKADDMQGINRHHGYVKALAEAGIPYDSRKVIWYHTEDRKAKPTSAIRDLIGMGTPLDAIACYNDEIAFWVYQTLAESGVRVPGDISITGFDDSNLATACPVRLTTVTHPKEKLGETAAELLLELLEDPDYLNNPRKKVFIPELVVGDSCLDRNKK